MNILHIRMRRKAAHVNLKNRKLGKIGSMYSTKCAPVPPLGFQGYYITNRMKDELGNTIYSTPEHKKRTLSEVKTGDTDGAPCPNGLGPPCQFKRAV